MTIKRCLLTGSRKLKAKKIGSPVLDAELLLAFTIKKEKSFLFAHPEKKLSATQEKRFNELIRRRSKHEPIAYIIGHKYFYGLDIMVNKNSLIPRPESEIIVEEVIRMKLKSPTIIDIGTGSGAIIIALAKNIRNAKFAATDISEKALSIAKKNAREHKVASKIKFLKGDLAEPLKALLLRLKGPAVITANLPYLPTNIWKKAMPDVKEYEPRNALDGGKDGMKYYRRLFAQLKKMRLKIKPTLIIEIDPSQSRFFDGKAKIKKDLCGRDRIVVI